ncbi:MAG: hypothetical protein R2568_03765 [Candidatus Scalindua sp.]|nr:hypothetical protein [Candidatus Scalindua sp.]
MPFIAYRTACAQLDTLLEASPNRSLPEMENPARTLLTCGAK